jgi:D-alanine-D-alanine ligase
MSRVVILFGGSSSERLVSVASAQNVSAHLPDARCWFLSALGAVFDVSPAELAAHHKPFQHEFVPTARVPTWLTLDAAVHQAKTEDADTVFFLALHGGDGENGVTQKQLEGHGVAFTGSGSRASADAFDKVRAKELAASKGARVAEAVSLPPLSLEAARRALSALFEKAPRWVLKPRADGSSHGLIHLKHGDEVEAAAALIARLALPYLAEQFVLGRELTVGVVDALDGGSHALPVSEVKLIPGGAFDYEGKYLGRGTAESTPAALEPEAWKASQALGVLTHQAVGCYGYSRTDMILTPDGPVLLEINTLPGMTKASFIPQQLAAADRPVKSFLELQLSLARARRDAGPR